MARTSTSTAALLLGLLAGCGSVLPGPDAGLTDAGSATLELLSGSQRVGTSWSLPRGSATTTAPLYRELRETFTLANRTSSAVTLTSATLTPGGDCLPEEWSLVNASPGTLPAGGTLDLTVRAYPMLGQLRAATLELVTNAGTLTVALTVRGTPPSSWALNTTRVSEQVLGTPSGDEQPGGLVVAANGDRFVSANVNFATNPALLVARANADGTLAWAKVWDGAFTDRARDPGQNGESGGAQGSFGADAEGNLYLAASSSTSSANSLFRGALARITPDGTMSWQKLWGYGAPTQANQNAELYALDSRGLTLYAVGTTGGGMQSGEGLALFLSLDPVTGLLSAARAFDLNPTFNDRAYAVRGDGQGSAYVGGNGNGRAWLMKVRTANTAPAIAWAKELPIGLGGNVNALDVDAAGNLYAALDVRGVETALVIARFSPDGAVTWARRVAGVAGDLNNVHALRVAGDALWVGGRIAALDDQLGDGWVGRFSLDGTLEWSAFHFSGTDADARAEHRVKGLEVRGADVYLLSQAYTGSANGVRYHGAWYAGEAPGASYALAPVDTAAQDVLALPNGALVDGASLMTFSAAPTPVTLRAADDKRDGVPPDADLMLTHLRVP